MHLKGQGRGLQRPGLEPRGACHGRPPRLQPRGGRAGPGAARRHCQGAPRRARRHCQGAPRRARRHCQGALRTAWSRAARGIRRMTPRRGAPCRSVMDKAAGGPTLILLHPLGDLDATPYLIYRGPTLILQDGVGPAVGARLVDCLPRTTGGPRLRRERATGTILRRRNSQCAGGVE
jgi:hypothetical protein